MDPRTITRLERGSDQWSLHRIRCVQQTVRVWVKLNLAHIDRLIVLTTVLNRTKCTQQCGPRTHLPVLSGQYRKLQNPGVNPAYSQLSLALLSILIFTLTTAARQINRRPYQILFTFAVSETRPTELGFGDMAVVAARNAAVGLLGQVYRIGEVV